MSDMSLDEAMRIAAKMGIKLEGAPPPKVSSRGEGSPICYLAYQPPIRPTNSLYTVVLGKSGVPIWELRVQAKDEDEAQDVALAQLEWTAAPNRQHKWALTNPGDHRLLAHYMITTDLEVLDVREATMREWTQNMDQERQDRLNHRVNTMMSWDAIDSWEKSSRERVASERAL